MANNNYRFHYLSGTPLLRGTVSNFTTPDGGIHEILGPSEHRRCVVFFVDEQIGGNVGVRPGTFGAVDASLAVTVGQQPLVFRYEDFGSLVQGNWFVRGAAGGVLIGIIEVMEG